MKKIVKFLSLIAIIFVMGITLSSCSYDFYGDFNNNGAEITEEDDFKFQPITVDDVKGYREAGKSFILFVGAAAIDGETNTNCVSAIKKINEEANYINYKGIILYLDVQDIIKSLSQSENAVKTLGIKALTDKTYGIVCVCYKEGKVNWETSNTSTYKKDLERFALPADESDNVDVENNISFRCITDYLVSYYPIESLEKF